MAQAVIRRQSHGIKVEQATITISRDEMTKLRKEALAKQVSVSRHVVDLIRLAWSVQGALVNTNEHERVA